MKMMKLAAVILIALLYANNAQAQGTSCDSLTTPNAQQLAACIPENAFEGRAGRFPWGRYSCRNTYNEIRKEIAPNIEENCEVLSEARKIETGEAYWWEVCTAESIEVRRRDLEGWARDCMAAYNETKFPKPMATVNSCEDFYKEISIAARSGGVSGVMLHMIENADGSENCRIADVIIAEYHSPTEDNQTNESEVASVEKKTLDPAEQERRRRESIERYRRATGQPLTDPPNLNRECSGYRDCLNLSLEQMDANQQARAERRRQERRERRARERAEQAEQRAAAERWEAGAEQRRIAAEERERVRQEEAAIERARQDRNILIIIVLVGGTIATIVFLWVRNLEIRERARQEPADRLKREELQANEGVSPQQVVANINAFFDKAEGSVPGTVWGRIKDRYEYSTKEGGPQHGKVDFAIKGTVSRPLSAMEKSERELVRVLYLIHRAPHGLNKGMMEDIQFGLVYADGKAAVNHYNYGTHAHKYAMTKGLVSSEDYVKHVANYRGITFETAKGWLIQLVERMSQVATSDPFVREAVSRLRGGQAWASGDLGPAFDPQAENSLFLGHHATDGTPVRFSGEGFIITVAAPGAGKSQANVIPNLLDWKGPAIVLDVKGELFAASAAWRAKNVGPVYKFAPLDPDDSHCFNPLDLVRSDPQFIWEDARYLADMILVPKSKNEPFFEEKGKDFLQAAIAAVCSFYEMGDPNRSLARIIDYSHGSDISEMFTILQMSDVRAMKRLGVSLFDLCTKNEKTYQSVIQTVQISLAAWESAQVEKVIERSDWHPLDLRSAPYPTVYISLKAGEIETYSSLLRVFVAQHIRTLIHTLPDREVRPILFMLDELPRLKKMPPIEEALELGRQYGIKLWMFSQSLGQLKESYPNADGMIGSCALRIFMNPSGHDGTAERVSKELGSFDSPLDGSTQKIAEPQDLAGPDYKNVQIVLPSGGKPIKVRKAFAYETEPYRSRMYETL